MTAGPVRTALAAARSYLARMAPVHLGSYPLALGAAWAAGHDVARSHTFTAVGPFVPSVAALLAAVLTFVLANTLGHRWALSAAIFTLASNSEWVRWAVDRMLERATGDDRRGAGTAGRVVQMLAAENTGSRVVRFALDRVGASAVHRAARVLASVQPGAEPIGARVREAMERATAREVGRRGVALAVLSAAVLVGAAVSAAVVR